MLHHRVTAATIRGEHDFLVSFYAPNGLTDANLGMPYCTIDEAAFQEMFDSESEISLSVTPDRILKFRGAQIPTPTSPEWMLAEQRVEQALTATSEKRRELLSIICRLARDWNDASVTPAQKEAVAGVFMPKLETMRVIDREVGSPLRQTFVLITVLSAKPLAWERFESSVLRDWFCTLEEVRSVFRVSLLRGRPDWHYWVDMIAEPATTDRIVDELFERCDKFGIRIGTRSMDLRQYLKAESVEGIEKSERSSSIIAFMQDPAARRIWSTGRVMLDAETMFAHIRPATAIAAAYFEHMEQGSLVPNRLLKELISKFYANWFCGNFAKAEDVRLDRLRAATGFWRSVYRTLEEAAQALVMKRLNGEYQKAIVDFCQRTGRENRIPAVRDNAIKGAFELLAEAGEAEDVMRSLRSGIDTLVLPLRNKLSHAKNYRDVLQIALVEDVAACGIVDSIARASRLLTEGVAAFDAIRQG